jgi:hypothetical protein
MRQFGLEDLSLLFMKSLKISMKKSEAVNRRMENTMGKEKNNGITRQFGSDNIDRKTT